MLAERVPGGGWAPLAVHRELGAKAEKGDAGHGIECATHRSAG